MKPNKNKNKKPKPKISPKRIQSKTNKNTLKCNPHKVSQAQRPSEISLSPLNGPLIALVISPTTNFFFFWPHFKKEIPDDRLSEK